MDDIRDQSVAAGVARPGRPGHAQFAGELAAASRHEVSRTLMDIERLESLVTSWPDAERATDQKAFGEYAMMLPTALAASHYLRWFETWARSRSGTKAASASSESIVVGEQFGP